MTHSSGSALLGGDAWPLAGAIQFIEAPLSRVLGELDHIGPVARTALQQAFVESLPTLLPLQAPWTRMLVAQVDHWTAIVNNEPLGGDPSAPGPSIARKLHARGLVAGHAPLHEPGHAVRQLWIQGPDGDGPLQTIRQIDLNATDGRWTWAETGDALPFEEIEKYKLPRKRDRFTRPMLFRYLTALGIRLDALAKADATLLQLIDVADWPIQEEGWEVGRALLR